MLNYRNCDFKNKILIDFKHGDFKNAFKDLFTDS